MFREHLEVNGFSRVILLSTEGDILTIQRQGDSSRAFEVSSVLAYVLIASDGVYRL